ncbi:LuxR C-terminal-related transcriptional regulator [Nocardioides ungokensis]|uniref:LuxR C-terminal-related transcriptional regulator n=1 Tax=Nocardioides ungokensis TaxID=1643322 RepID=UPI002484340A|nr:LuxR C-terminal-related transcriptional regulator [Nocardioides ungokensis]
MDRLLRATEPVIAVTAPPGYGKTTLLAAWAERCESPVAWVSCDRIGDDPESLWSAVTDALGTEQAMPDIQSLLDPDRRRVEHPNGSLVGVPPRPVAVVLDQLEALASPDVRRSVAAFATSAPAGWTLALASREELPLPAARLRVEGRLLEVGADDLALSRSEAAGLLGAAGVGLSDAETAELVSLTEGWPAALQLAALSRQAAESSTSRPFSANDRLMSDYLRSEVLDRLSRSQRKLLVRTSILEQVSGPLGDAVAGGSRAARQLDTLHRRTLLVTPVDGEGEWYRCHPLLRQLLRATLRAEGPDLAARLHARAAAWFEAQGDPERAIDHAYLAGDTEAFERLVLETMEPVWASGHIHTVERWMELLGRRSPQPHTPAMFAHGALIFALLGRPGDAERWAAVAEELPATGTLPDGDTVEGTLAYLRANLCRHGAAAMRRDAGEALEGLGPTSPYRATMIHTQGLSYLLDGDLEQADASFAHAYDLATSLDASPVTALVLAEQVQVAAAHDDWTTAESLVKRALEVVARGPYAEYWTSALVFASAARAAARRGDMPEARRQAQRAARLRPLLTYALPVVAVQALAELARAYLTLVDPSGARAVLEQAHGILLQRPDLGTLATAVRELEERVGQITAATPLGASSLTAAELRLVPLLPTHLTYPEIGERLFISRHTVKTHAGSVYRKLGVSSRAEAVERIIELGLV